MKDSGYPLEWVGPCPGGEFGASYVDGEAGPGVLKWWPHTDTRASRLENAVRRVTRARAVGYPAPAVLGLHMPAVAVLVNVGL